MTREDEVPWSMEASSARPLDEENAREHECIDRAALILSITAAIGRSEPEAPRLRQCLGARHHARSVSSPPVTRQSTISALLRETQSRAPIHQTTTAGAALMLPLVRAILDGL